MVKVLYWSYIYISLLFKLAVTANNIMFNIHILAKYLNLGKGSAKGITWENIRTVMINGHSNLLFRWDKIYYFIGVPYRCSDSNLIQISNRSTTLIVVWHWEKERVLYFKWQVFIVSIPLLTYTGMMTKGWDRIDGAVSHLGWTEDMPHCSWASMVRSA